VQKQRFELVTNTSFVPCPDNLFSHRHAKTCVDHADERFITDDPVAEDSFPTATQRGRSGGASAYESDQ
jgi:hypothetical protein